MLDTVLDGVDAPMAQRNRWFDLGAWGTFFQDSAKQTPLAEEARASFVLGTSCFLGFATSAKISWS